LPFPLLSHRRPPRRGPARRSARDLAEIIIAVCRPGLCSPPVVRAIWLQHTLDRPSTNCSFLPSSFTYWILPEESRTGLGGRPRPSRPGPTVNTHSTFGSLSSAASIGYDSWFSPSVQQHEQLVAGRPRSGMASEGLGEWRRPRSACRPRARRCALSTSIGGDRSAKGEEVRRGRQRTPWKARAGRRKRLARRGSPAGVSSGPSRMSSFARSSRIGGHVLGEHRSRTCQQHEAIDARAAERFRRDAEIAGAPPPRSTAQPSRSSVSANPRARGRRGRGDQPRDHRSVNESPAPTRYPSHLGKDEATPPRRAQKAREAGRIGEMCSKVHHGSVRKRVQTQHNLTEGAAPSPTTTGIRQFPILRAIGGPRKRVFSNLSNRGVNLLEPDCESWALKYCPPVVSAIILKRVLVEFGGYSP